jgi:hypothetical protein
MGLRVEDGGRGFRDFMVEQNIELLIQTANPPVIRRDPGMRSQRRLFTKLCVVKPWSRVRTATPVRR